MRKFLPAIVALMLVCSCSKDTPTPTVSAIAGKSIEEFGAGDTVLISGTNFSTTASANHVTFNGIPASVTGALSTALTVVFPAGILSGNITIVVSVNKKTGTHTFSYVRPPVVTTFAGSGLVSGYNDAKGLDARFSSMRGIAFDASGNLFVCDAGNHRVRKITPDGTVSSFAGNGVRSTDPEALPAPTGITVDRSSGTVYVVHTYPSGPIASSVRKITAVGVMSVLANLGFGKAITIDAAGSLYVSEGFDQGYKLTKVLPDGTVITLAGNSQLPTMASPGNGALTNALFGPMGGMFFNGADLLFTDQTTYSVRKITGMANVSNHAGVPFSPGRTDGPAATAQFALLQGLVMNAAGDLFVADRGNSCIRKISAAGVVTTIAGSKTGKFGYQDGNGTNALFKGVSGLAIDAAGNLYVSEEQNHCIRKITF